MNIIRLTQSLAIIYLLLLLALYLLQRHMLYQPTPLVAHDFQTVEVKHQGQTTEALLTQPSQKQAVIYFAGNAEQVVYTATDFYHHLPEHSTYLMKYRGYSGAEGQATEQNLYADALALYDAIQAQHQEITVVGRSLGSGVATYLASKRAVHRLVLITPFDSITAVAQNLLPVFPVNWLLQDHYDSKSRAASIQADTMVIIAEHDQVIPRNNTNALLASFVPSQLQVLSIDAGHNDLDFDHRYFDTIQQFLTSE